MDWMKNCVLACTTTVSVRFDPTSIVNELLAASSRITLPVASGVSPPGPGVPPGVGLGPGPGVPPGVGEGPGPGCNAAAISASVSRPSVPANRFRSSCSCAPNPVKKVVMSTLAVGLDPSC
jgi:hypothetical protein